MISLLLQMNKSPNNVNNVFNNIDDKTKENLLIAENITPLSITKYHDDDCGFTNNNGIEITINTIKQKVKNNIKYTPEITIQSTNNNQPKNIFLSKLIICEDCDFSDINQYINNCYIENYYCDNSYKIKNYFFKSINYNITQDNNKIILQNLSFNHDLYEEYYLLYIDGGYHVFQLSQHQEKYEFVCKIAGDDTREYNNYFNIKKEQLLDNITIVEKVILNKKSNKQKNMENFKIDGKDLVFTNQESYDQQTLLSVNCRIINISNEILNLNQQLSCIIEIQSKYYNSSLLGDVYFQDNKLYIDTTKIENDTDNKFIIINEEQESIMVEYNLTTKKFQQVEKEWYMYVYNIMEYIKLLKQQKLQYQQELQSQQDNTNNNEIEKEDQQEKQQGQQNNKQQTNNNKIIIPQTKLIENNSKPKIIYSILIVISILIILLLLMYIIYNSCCKKPKVIIQDNINDIDDTND